MWPSDLFSHSKENWTDIFTSVTSATSFFQSMHTHTHAHYTGDTRALTTLVLTIMDFKCHAGDLLCDNHHGPKDRVNIKKNPKQTKKQTRSTFKSQCSDFRIHTFPHALNLCPEFSCLAAIPYSFSNYCLIFYVESSNNSANTEW